MTTPYEHDDLLPDGDCGCGQCSDGADAYYDDDDDLYDDPYDVVMYDIDSDSDDLYALIELLADEARSWYAKRRLNALAAAGPLSALVADIIFDSRGRPWDPLLHPRDRYGKFIETGGFFRWLDKGGEWLRGQIERIDSDGVIHAKSVGNDHIPDGSPLRFKPELASKLVSIESPLATLHSVPGINEPNVKDPIPNVPDVIPEIPNFPEATDTQKRIYYALRNGDLPAADLDKFRSPDDGDLTGDDVAGQIKDLADRGLIDIDSSGDRPRISRHDNADLGVVDVQDVQDVPDGDTPDIPDSPNFTKPQRDLLDQIVAVDAGEGDGVGVEELGDGDHHDDLAALADAGAINIDDGGRIHLANPEGDAGDGKEEQASEPDIINEIFDAAQVLDDPDAQEAFQHFAENLADPGNPDNAPLPDNLAPAKARNAEAAAKKWWDERNSATPDTGNDSLPGQTDLQQAERVDPKQALDGRNQAKADTLMEKYDWPEGYLDGNDGVEYRGAIKQLFDAEDYDEAGFPDQAVAERDKANRTMQRLNVPEEDIAAWPEEVANARVAARDGVVPDAAPDVPDAATPDVAPDVTPDVPDVAPVVSPDVPDAAPDPNVPSNVVNERAAPADLMDRPAAKLYLRDIPEAQELIDNQATEYEWGYEAASLDAKAGLDPMTPEEAASLWGADSPYSEGYFDSFDDEKRLAENPNAGLDVVDSADNADVAPDGIEPDLNVDAVDLPSESQLAQDVPEPGAQESDVLINAARSEALAQWPGEGNTDFARQQLFMDIVNAHEMRHGGNPAWKDEVNAAQEIARADGLSQAQIDKIVPAAHSWYVNKRPGRDGGVDRPEVSKPDDIAEAEKAVERAMNDAQDGKISRDRAYEIAANNVRNGFLSQGDLDRIQQKVMDDRRNAGGKWDPERGIDHVGSDQRRVDVPEAAAPQIPEADIVPSDSIPEHDRAINQPLDFVDTGNLTDGAFALDHNGQRAQVGNWYRADAGGEGDPGQLVGFYDQDKYPGWAALIMPDGKVKGVQMRGMNNISRRDAEEWRAQRAVRNRNQETVGKGMPELDQFHRMLQIKDANDPNGAPVQAKLGQRVVSNSGGQKFPRGEEGVITRFGWDAAKNRPIIFVVRPGARGQQDEIGLAPKAVQFKQDTPIPSIQSLDTPDIPNVGEPRIDPADLPDREWQVPTDDELIDQIRGLGPIDLVNYSNAHVQPGAVYDQIQNLINDGRLEMVPNKPGDGARARFQVPGEAPERPADLLSDKFPNGAENQFEADIINAIDGAGETGLGGGDLVPDIDAEDAPDKMIALRELVNRGVLTREIDPVSGKPVYRRAPQVSNSPVSMDNDQAASALKSGADPINVVNGELEKAMKDAGFAFEYNGEAGISPNQWAVSPHKAPFPIRINGEEKTGQVFMVKKSSNLLANDMMNEVMASAISEDVKGRVGEGAPGLLYHPRVSFAEPPRGVGSHAGGAVIMDHAAYGYTKDHQLFGGRGLKDRELMAGGAEDSVIGLALFDFMINNTEDRHNSNQMYVKDPATGEIRALVIDNGFGFGASHAGTTLPLKDYVKRSRPRDLLRRVERRHRDEVRKSVAQFVAAYQDMDVDAMIEHIRALNPGMSSAQEAYAREWLTVAKGRVGEMALDIDGVVDILMGI